MNRPIEITLAEWAEIIKNPTIREWWGLSGETAQEFAAMVYGVKFNFQSGCPGYVGDLYILQGDSLEAPVVLTRWNGVLRLEA